MVKKAAPSNAQENSWVIKVEKVSMVFNMASEQLNSLKEYAIALARHELRFKEFRALQKVSFTVNKGDVFGIMGTNGSGKSTMLKIVAGVLEPTEGTCQVKGRIAPLIELGAGFDMELTARENIFLNGALLGYPKKFIEQHLDAIVEFAELEEFLDMPMKNYSSGMVARIAFAIATVIVPDVLIVDEVLSVGDFRFQKKCENRINDLIANHGVTVLIVSHSNEQIARLCNKAIWIEKGETQMMGRTRDVCRVYRALAGKEGSTSSKNDVLKLISKKVKVPKGAYDAIAGPNVFANTATMAKAAWPHGLDQGVVVMAPMSAPAYALAAVSLAGLYDAPVLLAEGDDLPNSTVRELGRLDPSKMVVIGDEEAISPKAIEKACSMFEKQLEVHRIGGSIQEICAHLLQTRQDEWGSTALLASSDYVQQHWAQVAAFAPYMYHNHAPLILCEQADYGALAFSQVLCFADDEARATSQVSALQGELLEFGKGEQPSQYGVTVLEWLEAHQEVTNADTIFFASADEPWDVLPGAAYISKLNTNVMLVDTANLDSMAAAIRYLSDRKNKYRKIIFLGGLMIIDDDDKELFAKALLP